MANNIKQLRLRRGITQIELAKLCNISQSALSGYETGRYEPDIDTLVRIAKIFNATIDEVVGVVQDQEISDIESALSREIHDLTDVEMQDILDYVQFKKSRRISE